MEEYLYIKIASDLNFEIDSDVINLAVKRQEFKTLIDICERSKMVLILDYRD